MRSDGGHNGEQGARPGCRSRFSEVSRPTPGVLRDEFPTGRAAQAALTTGGRAPSPPSPMAGRGKTALSWGTPGGPTGLGIGFQEHSITCPGQSPGEGAVYPSLPVSSAHYWPPTKKLLTFLKGSEYTVHLCGVGAAGTNSC